MEEETKKKQFTFRGKTLEELNAMDIREFAKHLKSRQRRFVLRRSQEIEKFTEKVRKKIEKNRPVKTHLRDILITSKLVGMKISVYDGKKFVPVEVVGEMIGHKLGEFAPTRARIKHGKAGVGATKGTKSKSKK
ncbi:30S ribosomal protein S19 [Candidatus Pacearchaeota archaeon CG10_big_fil_rev_8_21_14_0_10_34_12]|nr:MAG: 30S ribosomal protein S19 [Candidatus Pacearchaeota archaeon CG10_big_fil_rev_8_21_14_0_10_34_12]